MYKYDMIIDGESYKALFVDHMEAADFLDSMSADGSEIVVVNYMEVTGKQILEDTDFEWSYRVEMAATLLLPDYRNYKKWSEQEEALKSLGHIA